jgi:hypothetical protein
MSKSDTSRVSRANLRISSVNPPGWKQAAPGHVPVAGEMVYCTDGPAEVVKLLGRTSDGSRLMELRCDTRPQAFFASSSNVLIRDPSTEASAFLEPSAAAGGA